METKQYLKARIEKAANGLVRFIASDESQDRSGESIPAASWDLTNYLKSPRVLIDHDYNVRSIVGKAPNTFVEDGKLVSEFEFHDITDVARETKEMVDGGFLDTVSVGFLRKIDEAGKAINELLEISLVAVPCNPNARMLSIKSIGQENEEEVAKIEDFVQEHPKNETPDEEVPALADATPEAQPEEQVPTDPQTDDQPTDEKNMTEDMLASASQNAMEKYPYIDEVYECVYEFASAFMLDSTPVDMFQTLLNECIDDLKQITVSGEKNSSDAFQKTMRLLMRRNIALMDSKAGRVLSEKNRGIIEASLDAMRQATAALEELLQATTSQGVDEEKSTPQNERSSVDIKNFEAWVEGRRVIRALVTATSDGLSRYKLPRKN